MSKKELLRMFVLDAIADDYEDLHVIEAHVSDLAKRAGMILREGEVADALADLIVMDLAKAYLLSEREPAKEFDGVPSRDRLCDFYFWLTAQGKELQDRDYPGWPFTHEGSLRAEWQPPD